MSALAALGGNAALAATIMQTAAHVAADALKDATALVSPAAGSLTHPSIALMGFCCPARSACPPSRQNPATTTLAHIRPAILPIVAPCCATAGRPASRELLYRAARVG